MRSGISRGLLAFVELLGPLVALSFILAPVIGPAVVIMAVVWHSRRAERRRLREAREAVAEAWSLVETDDDRGDSWLGHRHGQPVRITWSTDRSEEWTELRVGSGLAPGWLVDSEAKGAGRTLGLLDLVEWTTPPDQDPPVQTGDPAFTRYRASGAAPRALAVLGDDPTRHAVAQGLAQLHVAGVQVASVRGGTLVIRRTDRGTSTSRLDAVLRRAAALARRLDIVDDDVLPRLDRHARSSSVPGVRLACLQALIDLEAPRGRIQPYLEAPDPRMRLLAAQHLGATDTLVELVAERETAPAVSVGALRALEAHPVAAPRAVAVAMERSEPAILAAAADLAGAARSEEALSSLIRLLDGPLRGWGEGEGWAEVRPIALALARALGRLETAEAELVLIALLDAPSNEVRTAAMRSLGQVGSVTAVQPILELAERPFPRLRRAAREAAARIQARVEHGEAGALSLSETPGEPGALSVASTAGGLEVAQEDRPADAAAAETGTPARDAPPDPARPGPAERLPTEPVEDSGDRRQRPRQDPERS